jgi:hypothetical protein
MNSPFPSSPSLAADITRAASRQTWTTIRLLVDKPLVDDAYRAYAYFRWVDDWLDQDLCPQPTRLAFVNRQQALLERCLAGDPPADLTPEERLLAELVQHHPAKTSGVHAYLNNMMAVMAFDAQRRGRLISQRELDEYTRNLAVAVTEALHAFIGRDCAAPHGELRYQAVSGAHITHMLRDTLDDARTGYYNLPRDMATANGIAPWDVQATAYRDWVQMRVHQARECFRLGRIALSQVECLRCRIAGYAYMRRFEQVLDCIEREEYLLRAEYTERKHPARALELTGWALWMALKVHRPARLGSPLTVR